MWVHHITYLSLKNSLLYYWWKDVILLLLSKSGVQMQILKLWGVVHRMSETYVLIFMCIISIIFAAFSPFFYVYSLLVYPKELYFFHLEIKSP